MAKAKQVRTRFQVRKFIGTEYAVVDMVVNATVGVHPTKDHARSFANLLNDRHAKKTRLAEDRCAAMLAKGAGR